MRAPPPSSLRVVEYYVEGAAVVCDSGNSLRDLILRRQQQHRGVEVLRARLRHLGDLAHARHDALRCVEDAAKQIDDDRKDDREQDDVPDPPEGHRGLLSATIAALRAIPGSAPRMTSNCALIAVTAPSSGRRCSDSTPCSAAASDASPAEMFIRPLRTRISATASTR